MTAQTAAPIRILIADDHPMVREGVAAVLAAQDDMELVGEAANGEEAVALFEALRPDVTLMDLQMPERSGLSAIEAIRALSSTAKILVLTTYAGDVQAVKALSLGATGYLLKGVLRKELLEAIRSVHAGRRHLHRDIAGEIAHHVLEESLSEREVAVLELAAMGKANKIIAHDLGLAEETIKSYMKSVLAKLGVADRTQAVMVAVKRGIISV